MIDDAGIKAVVKEYKKNNKEDCYSFDDICLPIINMVAIARDGKIVITERPKVYAREQRVSHNGEPYSTFIDGLHVDLKIRVEWPCTQYFCDKNGQYVEKSGKRVVKDQQSPISTNSLKPVTVSDDRTGRNLKNPITYSHICNLQMLGLYPVAEWVHKYNAVIPEQDRLELAERWQALQLEYERLVPGQISLARAKKLGSAKTKRSNKRVLSLANMTYTNALVGLGAKDVHELIQYFTKYELRVCQNYDYIWTSPLEHLGFAITLGMETCQRVFALYSNSPIAIDALHRWVQEMRKSGEMDMTQEDVQEALDLHAVKGVMAT